LHFVAAIFFLPVGFLSASSTSAVGSPRRFSSGGIGLHRALRPPSSCSPMLSPPQSGRVSIAARWTRLRRGPVFYNLQSSSSPRLSSSGTALTGPLSPRRPHRAAGLQIGIERLPRYIFFCIGSASSTLARLLLRWLTSALSARISVSSARQSVHRLGSGLTV
jgi:hypothetical protein